MFYLVGELAEIARVSVRTLHHYDRIGLLEPGSVSPAGYRLYSGSDLEKLQQILFFKELGFSLQEIADIINKPGFDRLQALKMHKSLLREKSRRLESLITTIDKTIQSMEGDGKMSEIDMFQAFDMSEIERCREKYADETKQKYGGTDAYKESIKKTSAYTKEDWAAVMMRGNEIHSRLATLMGMGAGDPQVQEAIADWRRHISDSYYNCTPEIFRGLADLYVSDERFTANIDKTKPGLARFMSEAMIIYCDRLKK